MKYVPLLHSNTLNYTQYINYMFSRKQSMNMINRLPMEATPPMVM